MSLLSLALSIIPAVTFEYSKFLGNTTNELGIDVPSYDQPIKVQGHWQPLKTGMYKRLGLDLNKDYATVWIPADIMGIDGKLTPDRLIFQGAIWKVIESDNWHYYDNWVEVIASKEKEYV